jgi:hypothetical protein
LNITDSGRYSNDYILTTSTTSFSSFYLYKGGVGLPLPLKLVAFNGLLQNKNTLLTWITSNEVNVSHFEIERSTDGRSFTGVATVLSQPGTADKTYRFTDVNTFSGINYYRLKMVDNDGRYTYSFIVKIDAGKKYSISIVPNPARDYFTISGADTFTDILITDIAGRTIKQMKKNISNRYETAGLVKGVYLVRLINNKESTSLKIVIE